MQTESPDNQSFSEEALLQPSQDLSRKLTALMFVAVTLGAGWALIHFERAGQSLGWMVAILPLFTLIAAAVTWSRNRGTTVDLQRGVVVTWQRVATQEQRHERALGDVEAVRLRVQDSAPGPARYRLYVVELTGESLEAPIWMGQSSLHIEADARAHALAKLLSLPLEGMAPPGAEAAEETQA